MTMSLTRDICFEGILGGSHTLPKKTSPGHTMSLHGAPASAPPFLENPGHKAKAKHVPGKRGSGSHKRRWGTLVEAAKSGRVGRLIARSRSEDSVCNANATSPSESDSNPSLAEAFPFGALAALRKKRKKFSGSRSKNGSDDSKSANLSTISGVYGDKHSKFLKRASSVPVRTGDVREPVVEECIEVMEARVVEVAATEAPAIRVQAAPTTAATPEEPLLLTTSTTTQPSPSTIQPAKSRNGAMMPNLPGVQPLSGHTLHHGWL